MEEEEVNVGKLESLEGVVEGPQDILVAVQMIPDLGGDEDVLALDGWVLLEEVADGVTDLVLVLVEPGTIQVPVSNAKGVRDGLVCLSHRTLVGEGTETEPRNGHAVAELERDSARHVAGICLTFMDDY